MSTETDEAVSAFNKSVEECKRAIGNIKNAANKTTILRVFPFTGGILFVAYAFFWPESYGHWLGTIVHAFRSAAGL